MQEFGKNDGKQSKNDKKRCKSKQSNEKPYENEVKIT